MKLTVEDLERLYIEMLEHEEWMKEMYLSMSTEHEDAGDRV